MTNYLVIENKGLIEKEDLFLIGSSTKRDDSTKIGMFGSGWKYALAYILRNHCDIRIFSGDDEIEVDTSIIMHRDKAVSVITIDGVKTSLTTSMGPQWTGWMAIRELVSNAIDEGDFKLSTIMSPQTFVPSGADKTCVYIECNSEMNECLRSYESYFAFDRKPEFENNEGRIFLKTKESDITIYRKGIRCYEKYQEGLFDVDINDIEINESRLVSGTDVINRSIRDIFSGPNVTVNALKSLLLADNTWMQPHRLNDTLELLLLELMKQGYDIINKKIYENRLILGIRDNYLIVRDAWYQELERNGHVISPFAKSNHADDFIEITNHSIDLNIVAGYMSTVGITGVHFRVGEWQSGWSSLAYSSDTIFIKYSAFKDYTEKQIACRALTTLSSDKWMQAL